MWLQHMPDGSKYYQETVVDPVTGKKRRFSVKVVKDNQLGRRDARISLAAKVRRYTRAHPHLSQVIQAYHDEQFKTVRPSTLRRNDMTLRRICDILEDPYMDQLTAGYIRNQLIQTGAANGTINEWMKRLKACLRWAYQNDYLKDFDVIGKLTALKDQSRREKIKDKFLEAEELRLLLDAMKVPYWKMLTEFLVLSGLRIGEALALNRGDVSYTRIRVNKTLDERTGELGPPKTSSSIREVDVQPELRTLLVEMFDYYDSQAENFRYIPLVFLSTINGERVSYYSYTKYLRETSLAVLGRKITPHTLRHTHTSLMAAAGVPIETISRRLGHENSKITREVYLHVTSRMKENDRQLVSSVTLLNG